MSITTTMKHHQGYALSIDAFVTVLVLLASWASTSSAFSLPAANTLSPNNVNVHSRLSRCRKPSPSNPKSIITLWSSVDISEVSSKSSVPSSDDNDASSDHHDDHGEYGSAVHQFEHRAKEKTFFNAAEKFIEKVGERFGERSAERLAERAAERSAERLAERVGERSAERLAERVGERSAERLAERVGERSAERLAERVGERSAERLAERVAETSAERLAERVGERSAERLAERSAERLAERVAERTTERIAERGGERLMEQAGIRSGEGTMVRLAERGGFKISARLSRGVMIALPAVGALFAMYLLKSDIKRVKEEASKKVKSALMLFVGAGIADFVDVIMHFVIVYGLSAHLSHHKLVLFEKVSMGCAILSTACAVLGEIVSLKMKKRRERRQMA